MEALREGELHPLQNPDILEIIFKGSTLQEVKRYRQVCKAWCLASSEAMSSSGRVAITGWKKDESSGLTGVCAYLAMVESDVGTFCNVPSLAENVVLHDETCDFPRFWTVIGNYIKSLHLFMVDFYSVEDFRHAIFQSCPNLENLKLTSCTVLGKCPRVPTGYIPPQFPKNRNFKSLSVNWSSSKGFSVSWMEFFTQFPSLEELSLLSNCAARDEIFMALGVVRRQNIENLKLKNLEFDISRFREPLELAAVLTIGNSSLVTLHIDEISMVRDSVALCSILDAHSGTLEKLSLDYDWVGARPLVNFPLSLGKVLGNLQELKLTHFPFKSMRFLRSVPNLKKLAVSNMNWPMFGNTDSQEIAVFPSQNCVEVDVSSDKHEDIEVEHLRKFSLWLPNLKRLKIDYLNNKTFPIVCETWPDLEHLEILESGFDDRAVTGLDFEDLRQMNHRRAKGNWKPITAPRPNITYLKNLQVLSIQFSLESHYWLNYCNAVYGFEKLPKLQRLKLHLGWDWQWESEAWLPLLRQFPWDRDADADDDQ